MSDQTLYRIFEQPEDRDVITDMLEYGVLVPVNVADEIEAPAYQQGWIAGFAAGLEPDSRSFLCSEHHATGSSNRCRMAKFGFVDSPCLMERVAIFKIGVDDE